MKGRHLLLYGMLESFIALNVIGWLIFKEELTTLRWANDPVHAVMESMGTVTAAVIAFILLHNPSYKHLMPQSKHFMLMKRVKDLQSW